MSFHWSCFIVPSCLEICSFIVILVCLSLFHLVLCAKKKKKGRKKKKKNREKKKKINKCAHICIQYKYSLSSYVDLWGSLSLVYVLLVGVRMWVS